MRPHDWRAARTMLMALAAEMQRVPIAALETAPDPREDGAVKIGRMAVMIVLAKLGAGKGEAACSVHASRHYFSRAWERNAYSYISAQDLARRILSAWRKIIGQAESIVAETVPKHRIEDLDLLRSFARERAPRVDWSRMSESAIRRALGMRQGAAIPVMGQRDG